MEEKDTYKKVAIPMTDKQAHEAFACETCKGFDGALRCLTEMIEMTFSTMGAPTYLKHLTLVANPDCDGKCVTGETMSIVCPCCKDSVYFNYSCFLPTEFQCPYCSADLTGGGDESQVTIRTIIENHNMVKSETFWRAPEVHAGAPPHRSATDVRGFGVPMQENEES